MKVLMECKLVWPNAQVVLSGMLNFWYCVNVNSCDRIRTLHTLYLLNSMTSVNISMHLFIYDPVKDA